MQCVFLDFAARDICLQNTILRRQSWHSAPKRKLNFIKSHALKQMDLETGKDARRIWKTLHTFGKS